MLGRYGASAADARAREAHRRLSPGTACSGLCDLRQRFVPFEGYGAFSLTSATAFAILPVDASC
jgi:hypothetical protein